MAIKTSGPINFQNIVDEFGGTGEAPLSDYYRGGPYVPNTNANIAIGTQGNPIALSQFYGARKEITLTYTMYGGGGAGGNGMADGNGSGSNNSGRRTYIITKAAYDAASGNPAVTSMMASATGGAGGRHGAQGAITGGTGSASDFGAGGSGGSPNSAAPNPTWGHWGAGGGGGGGDDGSTSYLNLYGSDAAGNAGVGAGAAAKTTGSVLIDVDTDYVVVIGGGGDPSAYANYKGGRGVPGHVKFSLSSGTGEYIGTNPNNGSANAHYTSDTAYNLRLTRQGQVLWYRVTEPQPTIFAQPINSSWGTSGANETDNFGNIEYGFRLQPNGETAKVSSGLSAVMQFPFTQNIVDWLPAEVQGNGAGADYEVAITKVSGIDPVFEFNGAAATLGQFYTMTQNLDVFIADSGRTNETCTVRLRIREVGNTTLHVDQNIVITLNTIPGG